MRRFYPDTNVVHLLRREWPPAEFDLRSRSRGLMLALGFHVVYELARGLVMPTRQETRADVRSAASFLADLTEIDYVPKLDRLIFAELNRAATGVEIVTVTRPFERLQIRQELYALARGDGVRAARFITEREQRAMSVHRDVAVANAATFQTLFTRDPSVRKRCKTVDGFRREFGHLAIDILRELTRQQRLKTLTGTLQVVLRDPDRFPLLSTWLNAQWYEAWISASTGSAPAADKRDDFRHLVESATSDVFVTAEVNLLRRAAELSPYRQAMSATALLAALQ